MSPVFAPTTVAYPCARETLSPSYPSIELLLLSPVSTGVLTHGVRGCSASAGRTQEALGSQHGCVLKIITGAYKNLGSWVILKSIDFEPPG